MNLKGTFLKGLEFALGAHGILHIFEFGVAIYEEAYITASFAAFGAIVPKLTLEATTVPPELRKVAFTVAVVD